MGHESGPNILVLPHRNRTAGAQANAADPRESLQLATVQALHALAAAMACASQALEAMADGAPIDEGRIEALRHRAAVLQRICRAQTLLLAQNSERADGRHGPPPCR